MSELLEHITNALSLLQKIIRGEIQPHKQLEAIKRAVRHLETAQAEGLLTEAQLRDLEEWQVRFPDFPDDIVGRLPDKGDE
jgi:hypothetical protein